MTEFDWFAECFFADLDSAYTADIVCCDDCYSDFISYWPGVTIVNNSEFERSCIPLFAFYSTSKTLSGLYSERQFKRYIKRIRCQRCGKQLSSNIWVYNFPFDIPKNFEEQLVEIAEIANSFPFLLLSHDLAMNSFQAISEVSKSISPAPLPTSLFRARSIVGAQPIKMDVSEFDFPPRNVVHEGRYNHAGCPVLYLSSDSDTCYQEMRCQQCLIAEIEFNIKVKTLDLTILNETYNGYSDVLMPIVYSMLLSAKQEENGWYKPKYVFSRFISDCAKKVGIQAIKYPSTRITKSNFNIVLLDSSISLKKYGIVKRYFTKPEYS